MSARSGAGAAPAAARSEAPPTQLFFRSRAVRQDKRAKSLSFYSTGEVVQVTQDTIRQLLEASGQDPRGRARLCLHTSPESNFHEMIVVERRGDYFRPHKHLTKGESCVVLEGSAAFFVFADDGTTTHASVVGPGRGLVCRVEANRWHTVVPLSPHVVYLESKPGPFLSVQDSVYPAWAPDGSDRDTAAQYMDSLLKHVERDNTGVATQ